MFRVLIRCKVKDIIIRGGENIDRFVGCYHKTAMANAKYISTTVENALFTEGVLEVAAVAVPDERLGELVSAVVTVKPEYQDKITEQSLKALASTRFVHGVVYYERLIFEYLDCLVSQFPSWLFSRLRCSTTQRGRS